MLQKYSSEPVPTKYTGIKEDAYAVNMKYDFICVEYEIILKSYEEIGSDVDANAGFLFLHQVLGWFCFVFTMRLFWFGSFDDLRIAINSYTLYFPAIPTWLILSFWVSIRSLPSLFHENRKNCAVSIIKEVCDEKALSLETLFHFKSCSRYMNWRQLLFPYTNVMQEESGQAITNDRLLAKVAHEIWSNRFSEYFYTKGSKKAQK